ncbi:MAG: rubrerythrin family protein [Ruminococcus sp.]|nr:rubrerythrin family protein [Ruminococcus sp.]
MAVNFKTSQTCLNLMRAFAGESQARNRYTFAAEQAKQMQLPILEAVFNFTANQELAHANVFYGLLKSLSGDSIHIDGTYPVDQSQDMIDVLNSAAHNEFEEANDAYPAFAQIAAEEGFAEAAAKFRQIAEIEKIHGERLTMFARAMQSGTLFQNSSPAEWFCINCGKIHSATEAPQSCPVCGHPRGNFIRREFAPYTGQGGF